MSEIWINIVFEDVLSEMVLRKLLNCSTAPYVVPREYNAGGFGWIKRRINGFNQAAKGMPYLILTDLDVHECAPVLIRDWLDGPKHPNLLFRVAVKEVESWLLGCREPMAIFLGVEATRIPTNVEEIPNPKEFIVNLAKRSRKKGVRADIAPEPDSTAKVGPDYNGRLIQFVESIWDPEIARERSPSLRRTMEILDDFQPIIEGPL